MMHNKKCLAFSWGMTIVVCTLSLSFVGCGPKGLDVQVVEGTVTLDGTPLDEATITFVPADGGNMAFALTDAKGKYRLSTLNARPEKGTTQGKYDVSFDKMVQVGSKPTAEQTADPNYDPSKYNTDKTVQIVPKKYLETNTSGFSVTVEKGKNEFNFELKSK